MINPLLIPSSIGKDTLLVRVDLHEIHTGTARRPRTRIKPIVILGVEPLNVLNQITQVFTLEGEAIRVPFLFDELQQLHLLESRG